MTYLQSAVIFDIDGTLSDATHRHHHLKTTPKNWEAFNKAMHLDTPHKDVVALAQALHHAGHRVLLVTGRDEEFRMVTETWLNAHGVIYDELYMRPRGDRREDTTTKAEALRWLRAAGYAPWLVVEDRNRLVKMWREQGLTCLQCAEGDF